MLFLFVRMHECLNPGHEGDVAMCTRMRKVLLEWIHKMSSLNYSGSTNNWPRQAEFIRFLILHFPFSILSSTLCWIITQEPSKVHYHSWCIIKKFKYVNTPLSHSRCYLNREWNLDFFFFYLSSYSTEIYSTFWLVIIKVVLDTPVAISLKQEMKSNVFSLTLNLY